MEDDTHKVDAVENLSDVGTDGSSDVSWGGGGDSDAFRHCNSPHLRGLTSCSVSGPPPSYASATYLTAWVIPSCHLLRAECCVLL